jgi:hypothetical protein
MAGIHVYSCLYLAPFCQPLPSDANLCHAPRELYLTITTFTLETLAFLRKLPKKDIHLSMCLRHEMKTNLPIDFAFQIMPITLQIIGLQPHLALAFTAKFWCLFCRMEIIIEPATRASEASRLKMKRYYRRAFKNKPA